MTKELIITDAPHVVEGKSESELSEWYSSMLTDFALKMTLASVLFFITWPWAALLWPPNYSVRRCNE
jgi:hypothetical protein